MSSHDADRRPSAGKPHHQTPASRAPAAASATRIGTVLLLPQNEGRRFHPRAKLDALFFHLYGVTNRNDTRHIHSASPIVERQETTAHSHHRSRNLCLVWLNALAAREPDAKFEG